MTEKAPYQGPQYEGQKPPEHMDPSQVASYLGFDVNKMTEEINNFMQSTRIRARRVGNQMLFDTAEIVKFRETRDGELGEILGPTVDVGQLLFVFGRAGVPSKTVVEAVKEYQRYKQAESRASGE